MSEQPAASAPGTDLGAVRRTVEIAMGTDPTEFQLVEVRADSIEAHERVLGEVDRVTRAAGRRARLLEVEDLGTHPLDALRAAPPADDETVLVICGLERAPEILYRALNLQRDLLVKEFPRLWLFVAKGEELARMHDLAPDWCDFGIRLEVEAALPVFEIPVWGRYWEEDAWLSERSRRLFSRGDLAEAARVLEEESADTVSVDESIALDIDRARLLDWMGRADDGLALARAAEHEAQQTGRLELWAAAVAVQAACHTSRWRLDEAIELLQRTLAGAGARLSAGARRALLMRLASARISLGVPLRDVYPTLREAMRLTSGDRANAASDAFYNYVCACIEVGDLAIAAQELAQAEREAPKRLIMAQLQIALLRARLSARTGRKDVSRWLGMAERLAQSAPATLAHAPLYAIGKTYADLGHLGEARQLYLRASQAAQQSGDLAYAAQVEQNASACASALGDHRAATDGQRRAADLFQRASMPLPRADTLDVLAELHDRFGQPGSADACRVQARAIRVEAEVLSQGASAAARL